MSGYLINYPDDVRTTPLKWPKFAKIKLSNILEDIIQEYNLRNKATHDRWVYMSCIQGIYGLPHAGSLRHDILEERLNAAGYRQSKFVLVLWKHDTHPIQFMLVINNLGVKYTSHDDTHHLINTLKQYYNSWWMVQIKKMLKLTLIGTMTMAKCIYP